MADNVSTGAVQLGCGRCGAVEEVEPGRQQYCNACYSRGVGVLLRVKLKAAVAPGADTGAAGGGGGPVETRGVEAVDIEALCDFVLRTDAGPGDCGYIIGKLTDLQRELETERRQTARLREELESARRDNTSLHEQLALAREAGAEALVQAGEAAERAWEYSLKLDILRPAVNARLVLEKNARTIRVLRALLNRPRPRVLPIGWHLRILDAVAAAAAKEPL